MDISREIGANFRWAYMGREWSKHPLQCKQTRRCEIDSDSPPESVAAVSRSAIWRVLCVLSIFPLHCE